MSLIGVFRTTDRAWRIEIATERNGDTVYLAIRRTMPMGRYRSVAALAVLLAEYGLTMADLVED